MRMKCQWNAFTDSIIGLRIRGADGDVGAPGLIVHGFFIGFFIRGADEDAPERQRPRWLLGPPTSRRHENEVPMERLY